MRGEPVRNQKTGKMEVPIIMDGKIICYEVIEEDDATPEPESIESHHVIIPSALKPGANSHNPQPSDMPKSLPRIGLLEPNFHRFESFIKTVLEHGRCVVPEETLFSMNMRPSTFCNRMTDAILGFKRYNYTPDDPTWDKALLRSVKITCQQNVENGVNIIDETYQYRVSTDPSLFTLPRDLEKLKTYIKKGRISEKYGTCTLSDDFDYSILEALRAQFKNNEFDEQDGKVIVT